MLEADRKTINRWLAYFREIFPKSQIWQTVRGFIHPAVANHILPGSLVEHYLETIKPSQIAILNCLVVLTTGKMMEQ